MRASTDVERDRTSLTVGARPAPRIRASAGVERVWERVRSDDPALWFSALALMMAIAAAFLFYETRGTTFWIDEWSWALTRRGGSLASFLDAHNGHLSLVPVVIYKLLFATAGLRSYAPYRIVVILAHLGCTTLLFVYARRRIGGFLALAAAAVLLFFGPGWQNILWPFQVAWLISLGAGIGALLLLDRDDGLGRAGACALIAMSLASSGVGFAIAIGIVVELLIRRAWRHWWVVGAPLALYVLWSVGYQDTALTKDGLVAAPDFAWNAAASALGAVLGFGGGLVPQLPGSGANLQDWGQPLAVVAVVAALWRLLRLGRSSARATGILAAGASFWFLTGLTRWFISAPYESRYLYVGAVIVLLAVVELAAGLRIAWVASAVIAGIAALAVITNIGDMRTGAAFLRSQAQVTRAQLGALDISRPIVASSYGTGPFGVIRAGQYFATERALGTPAARPGEIAVFQEPAREAADAELAAIHRLRLLPSSGGSVPAGSAPTLDAVSDGTALVRGACTSFTPASFTPLGAAPSVSITVPMGGLLVRTGPASATVGYRRFGGSFLTLGTMAANARAELRIGPDLGTAPWHLQVSSTAPTSLCGLAQ